MVTARKSTSNPFTVASQHGGTPGDAGAWLSDWLATHSSLLSAGLGQLNSGPLAILTEWLELQNELARQWQTQAAEAMQLAWGAGSDDKDTHADASAATPAALYEPWRRVLDDW